MPTKIAAAPVPVPTKSTLASSPSIAQVIKPLSAKNDALTAIVGKSLETSLGTKGIDLSKDGFDSGKAGTMTDLGGSGRDLSNLPAIPSRDGRSGSSGISSMGSVGDGAVSAGGGSSSSQAVASGGGRGLPGHSPSFESGNLGGSLAGGRPALGQAPGLDNGSGIALSGKFADLDPASGLKGSNEPNKVSLGSGVSANQTEAVVAIAAGAGGLAAAGKAIGEAGSAQWTGVTVSELLGAGTIGEIASTAGLVGLSAVGGIALGTAFDNVATAIFGDTMGNIASDFWNGSPSGKILDSSTTKSETTTSHTAPSRSNLNDNLDMTKVDPMGGSIPSPIQAAQERLNAQKTASNSTWKVRPSGEGTDRDTSGGSSQPSMGAQLINKVSTDTRDFAASAAKLASGVQVLQQRAVNPVQPDGSSSGIGGSAPRPPSSPNSTRGIIKP